MGGRDVLVWVADVDRVPEVPDGCLDAVELDRYEKLLWPDDRRRFLVGCATLKAAAGALLGRAAREVRLDRACRTCEKPHGKPRVIDGDGVEASLSHSGQRVVVAVTLGAALGVDVEVLRASIDHATLAPTVLARTEYAPDLTTFLAYWTCKEAMVKATGDGLTVPLSELTIADPARRPRLTAWRGRPELVGAVQLHRFDPGPAHLAALAVLDPEPRPVHQLDAAALLDDAF